MGNPTDSQLVFEHWRDTGGPVPRRIGRRNPVRHPAEMDWRKELVEASKRAQGSPPEPEEQPTLQYTVELVFFVSDTSLDLDNLTKPVLDTLFLGRAHSLGRLRQQVGLIGYALLVNGLSVLRHERRGRLPAAA
jgi:hypothetical protein